MVDLVQSILTNEAGTLNWLGKIFFILLFFVVAWLVKRFSSRAARRLTGISNFSRRNRRLRAERQLTLQGLIASGITLTAFALAFISSLALFVDFDSLLWVIGLFTAGFGLGARPIISDFLTGVSFMFEDAFDVGEKVEILGVEGVLEEVNLRTSTLRAPTGELYIVPNGEIRLIRNFSRGRFSTVKITLKIPGEDLRRAISLLEGMADDAVVYLPNLIESWHVINESGIIGQDTELTLVANARFGHGAEMRPKMLALVQEKFSEENIRLVN